MSSTSAGIPVEVVRAESPRFRHSLLLVHGFWTGAWIWRGFASYLAHRGWDAYVPSFLANGPGIDLAARLEFLDRFCATLPAAPVVVAHEAGVVPATMLARAIGAPALVLFAPLVLPPDGGALGVLAHPSFWWARAFGRVLGPPRGRLAEAWKRELGEDFGQLRSDSAPFFRSVLSSPAGIVREGPPGFVSCSTADPLTPATAVERLAARSGWTFDVHESAGHFPMRTPGWERIADRVHRWAVRVMGADLLEFLDDEDDAE
jgi:hypothetical protein